MKTIIPIDRSGRLVLPKAFRSRLNLQAGDLLEIESGSDEVRIRRLMAVPSRIIRENGRAVWDAPAASATAEEVEAAIRRGREDRDSRASGL